MQLTFSIKFQSCNMGPCFCVACDWSACLRVLRAESQLIDRCSLCACGTCCWNLSLLRWKFGLEFVFQIHILKYHSCEVLTAACLLLYAWHPLLPQPLHILPVVLWYCSRGSDVCMVLYHTQWWLGNYCQCINYAEWRKFLYCKFL